jgi:hypothetical protein
MLASSVLVVLLHGNVGPDTTVALDHCWSISTGNCLTTHLTALILLQATTTCLLLPTWRTGCYHSASTVMRSWWKLSKTWLSEQAAAFFDTGIQNLNPWYDKYLSCGGNCLEN